MRPGSRSSLGVLEQLPALAVPGTSLLAVHVDGVLEDGDHQAALAVG